MKFIAILAVAMLAAALSGCATVFEGTSQEVTVVTNPSGASCVFERQGLQVGTIASTPGTANIRKSKYDITIRCTKTGYQEGTYLNHSGTTATIAANVAADLLLTAGISSIVDSADGADNKYDSAVNITLLPISRTYSSSTATQGASYQPGGTTPANESDGSALASYRADLGVTGSTVTSSSTAAINMSDPHGAFITGVARDGPAARSGIQPGDIIVTFGGLRVDTYDSLTSVVATTAAGSVVKIGIYRQGQKLEVAVQL